MIKKYLRFLLIILALAVGLGIATQAADVTPANSAINAVTQTLYFPSNNATSPEIKVFKYTDNGWSGAGQSAYHRALDAGQKCYGLAVSADGTKLYASINPGSVSTVRVYNLDGLGNPSDNGTDMTKADGSPVYWSSSSCPAGMALGANDRLFVADMGLGKFRVFNTANNTWVEDITEQLAGKLNMYDIATTPVVGNTYKIYLSRKTLAGEIYVFTYNTTNNAIAYSKTINTGLTYPTYLKVSGDKLFVAVNGTDGNDIKVYSTADEAEIGSVQSGIVGSYGWTALDISQDGDWLFFKKSQDSSQAVNKLYKIRIDDISGSSNPATEVVTNPTVNRADGLALAFNRSRAAGTYNPTGSIQNFTTASENQAPYVVDGGAGISQVEYTSGATIAEGSTIADNRVKLVFAVVDADSDMVTPIVQYRYRLNASQTWGSYTSFEASAVQASPTEPGTAVEVTLPESGTLADGQYQWMVKVKDALVESVWYSWGGGTTPQFIVDTSAAPTVTSISPQGGIQGEDIPNGYITGTNFVSGATARLTKSGSSDIPLTATFVSATRLNINFTVPGTATLGTWNVVVENPNGRSGTLADGFTVYSSPAPTVTGITPNNGEQDQTVAIINITGSNFVSGAQVELRNGTDVITADSENVADSDHISCSIAIPATATLGAYNVIVINPDTQEGQLDSGFTVFAAGTSPRITNITPSVGAQGATITGATLTGTNFVNGATVILARTGEDNISATVNFVDSNNVNLDFSIPADAALGDWTIILTNPNGQSGSLIDGFTISATSAPTVSGITPNNGEQGQTVTIINITGTDFVSGAQVELRNGTDVITADSENVADSAHISCSIAIPAAATLGTYNVVVINPDTQEGLLNNGFTVYAQGTAPTVTGITPANGGQGANITGAALIGTNFVNGASVILARTGEDNISATVTFVDGNNVNLDFSIPADAALGDWTIILTNPNGQSGSLADGFTINESGENPEINLPFDGNRTNIFWISVPYNTPYTTASDIIADINAQNSLAADSGALVSSIGRWNGSANPQEQASYDYLGVLGWAGTDFEIIPGEALYLNIVASSNFTLQGSHNPGFIFNLTEVGGRTNVFWVSLPYSGNYTDAASIIADINASAGLAADSGALVTSIGRWDGSANPQEQESYDYLGVIGWTGTNFTFQPGEGYYINIVSDIDNWSPTTP